MCNLNPLPRTSDDRENRPHTQELVLHPQDGGRDGSVLPCERDGRPSNDTRHSVRVHAEDGSRQAQDGSAGRNPLHILNCLEQSELAALVSDTAADVEAEQQLADVRAAIPVTAKCKFCLGPIKLTDDQSWMHLRIDSPLSCMGKAQPVVIGSPAYQLPEVKSAAEHFADTYRELHDLPFSFVSHLVWAYLMGQQDERLKGGK